MSFANGILTDQISSATLAFRNFASRIGSDARVCQVGPISFVTGAQYALDLTQPSALAQLNHPIQSMFVDCSNCLFMDTLIQCGNQNIVCKAGSQGYYPLTVITPQFTITNFSGLIANTITSGTPSNFPTTDASNCSINIEFYNVPFIASQWQSKKKRSVSFQQSIHLAGSSETYQSSIVQLLGFAYDVGSAAITVQANSNGGGSASLLTSSITDYNSYYNTSLLVQSLELPSGYPSSLTQIYSSSFNGRYSCNQRSGATYGSSLLAQVSCTQNATVGAVIFNVDGQITMGFGSYFGYNVNV